MRLTYNDLLDYLAGYMGKDVSPSGIAAIRAAAQAGIRELKGHHDWMYYRTLGRVVLSAPYTTGTIAFDYTGGSSELLVTLSGGTFPTWLASGILIINGVPYDVDERLTGTTATLTTATNPGEDVAAGTTYMAVRDEYPLPTYFDRMGNAAIALNGDANLMRWADPQNMVLERRDNPTTGRPIDFTVVGSSANDGTMVLKVWPFPDAAYTIDFDYKRRPRDVKIAGEKAGLVTTTASSATVTGVNTSFTSAMAGSVLRVGRAGETITPSGLSGTSPALFEGVIDEVASATSLTLTAVADQTISRAAYIISDPVDIEPLTMETALYAMCARALRLRTRTAALAREIEQETIAIILATENDSRYYGNRGAMGRPYGRSILDGPQGVSGTSNY